MSDEQVQDEQPKTAQDIRLDALEQQLAELKQSYEAEKQVWQDANKSLFTMLNGRVSQDAPQVEEQPKEPTVEGFVNMFKRK